MKPFHIGTEVIMKGGLFATVLWVDPIGGMVRVDPPNWADPRSLVHADDGSPLGEWEPIVVKPGDDFEIKIGTTRIHVDETEMDWLAESVQDAINDIIRGEARQ